MLNIQNIDWAKVDNLLPVVIQDYQTAQVLMLGYMNQDALAKTLTDGVVCFFSRTKGRLWVKGETSGNFLKVVEMGLDCDNDSLLILVNPVGVTCHTGAVSCFEKSDTPDLVFLANLEKLINERKSADPESSYTAQLFAKGTKRIAQKVGEEGVETALASVAGDNAETISESADLMYHLTVLLADRGLTLGDVIGKLKERHK